MKDNKWQNSAKCKSSMCFRKTSEVLHIMLTGFI